MRRYAAVVAVGLLVLGTSGAMAAEFSVRVDDAIETPAKTVTVDEESYEVTSIARVWKGDTLTVETTGPDGEAYRVYVHGIEDGTRTTTDTKYVPADSDGTVTFDTSEFTAGSYVVSIYHDGSGTYYDPQPVVIPAYEVALTSPQPVAPSESVELSASVTEVEPGYTVDAVEIVVANDEATERLEASGDGSEYVADLAGGELPPGEYRVYAVAYSPEEASGDTNEVIGISEPTMITVEEEQPTTTTTSSGQTDSAESTTATQSTVSATTADKTTTSGTTTPSDTTTTGTAGTVASSRTTTEQASRTNQSSTTIDTTTAVSQTDVITPNSETQQTTSNGGAGGVPLALLALLVSIAIVVLRSP